MDALKNSLTFHLATVLLLATAAASQTAQTLIMSGDPSPDGNGTVGGIGYPTINDKGEVAVVLSFNATQSPPLDYSGIFLFSTQSATTLVRGGDPSPDGNGVFEYFGYEGNFPEQVVVNDNGSVAFAAYLTQTNGGQDIDSSGIFGANATDGVFKYVRNTDPAPDGNGFFGPPDSDPFSRSLSLPGLDNNDRASFHAVLNNTSGGEFADDRGIFRADDMTVTKLLRDGQPEPFGPDTVLHVREQFGSNSVGQVEMEARIGTPKGPGAPPGGEEPPLDIERIYVANEVLLQQVFSSGGPPPDGIGTIASMQRTRIADNGHITFESQVSGRRLFFWDGMLLQEIVRQGDMGPGETDPFTFSSYPGLDSNIQDEVVFSAILERNAVPPDNRTSAIYRWRNGNLTVALHEGDPAPDGNGTFGDLAHHVFVNNGGQIVFAAEIIGAVPPPPIGNDVGIFVIESSGTIHQVARNGTPLAGSTALIPVFIGSFDFNGDSVFDDAELRLAGVNAINDSGEVPFWAGLGDGSQGGLFLWGSPEIISLDMDDGSFGDWEVSP